MRLNYKISQVNSSFDDSVFFVKNLYYPRSFLFDCGRLGGLSLTELLTISDIFVSHTHMDHFFGFDRIIRGKLSSTSELRLYGPPGIIKNVEGKFNGYTWNLVEDYSFKVIVFELCPNGRHKSSLFSASNCFSSLPIELSNDFMDLGHGFNFSFEFFEHKVPSLGYRLSEPKHFHIIKDNLLTYGYIPGNWITTLKNCLNNDQMSNIIQVPTALGSVSRSVEELKKELVLYIPPQVVTYITDCSPAESEIAKAIDFAKNSDLLIIESVFMDKDYEHALEKRHLTIGLAKKIFTESRSKFVRFTHFSSRYEPKKAEFLQKLYEGISNQIYSLE